MCGRFERKVQPGKIRNILQPFDKDIQNEIDEDELEQIDIRPTNQIIVIFNEDSLVIKQSKWGIKFRDGDKPIFNSRIETIKEKKYWYNRLEDNRCIIPMTGFYEWKTEGKTKTRYRISLDDTEVFFAAGIYREESGRDTVSIITCEPNKEVGKLHSRMPVILTTQRAVEFLKVNIQGAISLCVPYSGGMIVEESNIPSDKLVKRRDINK